MTKSVTLEDLRDGESFDDTIFEGLDLASFDLSGKDFYRCTFRDANLSESRWRGARLEACVIERCDVTRMSTVDLRAHGVTFRGCKVMGVEWTKSSLSPDLRFEDCDLRYTSFVGVHLSKTAFLRCKATEVQFIDVDLTDADFSGSELTGSSFRGVKLDGANFITATGAHLDPATNRVKGVRVGAETAALLAASFGMKVSGYSDPSPVRRKR